MSPVTMREKLLVSKSKHLRGVVLFGEYMWREENIMLLAMHTSITSTIKSK